VSALGIWRAAANSSPDSGGEQAANISPEMLKQLAELIRTIGGASGSHHSIWTPDYLKAAADLISAVAWPVATIVCVVLFRRQLVSFIGNVQTVKLFGAEVSLRIKEELAQSAQEAANTTGKSQAPSEKELARATLVGNLASDTDISIIRRQAEELASEYEQIRRSMPSSDERTRRMEVVVSKMRTIGRAFYPLRREFAQSSSPGRRLVTIAAVQVEPDFDILDWLASRLRDERPFVGYHALVAILVAMRAPEAPEHLPAIKTTVQTLRQSAGSVGRDTDRIRALTDIEGELAALESRNTKAN
jgi:hypothetical protein